MPVRAQLAGQPGSIMFIGDFPADEELIKGLPLVGAAGFLFAQALRAANLASPGNPPGGFLPGQRGETRRICWERRQYSITNVFGDQPPGGEVRNWCAPAAETKNWADYDLPPIRGAGYLRPEYSHHLERLRKEILECAPNLIVPMGGIALWAVMGSAEIDTYRGALAVSTRLVPGIKLIPVYHPGHVLRQYKLLITLISDLLKAAREMNSPEFRVDQKEIWLEPSLQDLEEFRRRYIKPGQGPLSVDIETGGRQISCLSLSPSARQSLIVPFVDYRRPDRSYWSSVAEEVRAWEFVAEVLGDPSIEKLFQNGSYDVFWFLDWAGIAVRNYSHDLRLVHQVLCPELPKSLKFMAATYLNTWAWKAGVQHSQEKRDA